MNLKGRNLYQVLDAQPDYSQSKLKECYHSTLKRNSPIFMRRYGPVSEEKRKELSLRYNETMEAYRILSNERLRFVYNILGPQYNNQLLNNDLSTILTIIINKENLYILTFVVLVLLSIFFSIQLSIEYFQQFTGRLILSLIMIAISSINLIVIRINRSLKKVKTKLPSPIMIMIYLISIISLIQFILIMLHLDFHLNLNVFISGLPAIFFDLCFNGYICFMKDIPATCGIPITVFHMFILFAITKTYQDLNFTTALHSINMKNDLAYKFILSTRAFNDNCGVIVRRFLFFVPQLKIFCKITALIALMLFQYYLMFFLDLFQLICSIIIVIYLLLPFQCKLLFGSYIPGNIPLLLFFLISLLVSKIRFQNFHRYLKKEMLLLPSEPDKKETRININ